MIAIHWVCAAEGLTMDDFQIPSLVTGWMVCHSLSHETQVEEFKNIQIAIANQQKECKTGKTEVIFKLYTSVLYPPALPSLHLQLSCISDTWASEGTGEIKVASGSKQTKSEKSWVDIPIKRIHRG